MCLAAMGIAYLQTNWAPGLIHTRWSTKILCHQKECNNPPVVNPLCNLYGTHWCRIQCITSGLFWLWIMAVTWLHLPLTLPRLGLRSLGMWTWAVHLRYIRFSQRSVRVLGWEETPPWTRWCNKLHSTTHAVLSKFVSQNAWLWHYSQTQRGEANMFSEKEVSVELINGSIDLE